MARSRDDRFFDRIQALETGREKQRGTTFSLSDYLNLSNAYLGTYSFNGNSYTLPVQTSMNQTKQEEPDGSFLAHIRSVYKADGPVFACIEARRLVFSEMRFKFRSVQDRKLYGNESLRLLERPGPNQTTGELLSRMEQDVSLAGNWYGYLRPDGTIKRLRPDWVTILIESERQPDNPAWGLDAELKGYLYKPGGPAAQTQTEVLYPEQVAHWSPLPDPEFEFRGMSWITPVLREVMGDKAATDHKLKFFENAATPNYAVIAGEGIVSPDQFSDFLEAIEGSSVGTANAYKTLYLMHGADIRPLGVDLRSMDFKSTQGAGETRVAAAARVPAVIAQFSEGLAGSTLNAGNFGMARRLFADGFCRPQWRSAAACLEKFTSPGDGGELWYDESDVGFLREDEKDVAEIKQMNAAAMRQLVDAGYDPETVTVWAKTGDYEALEWLGLPSVQLQEAQAEASPDMTEQQPPEMAAGGSNGTS